MSIKMLPRVFSVFLALALILLSSANCDENAPEQIHLAYTGVSSERIIGYVTPSPSLEVKTLAAYGTDPEKLDRKATGKSFVFGTAGHNFTIHNVKVSISKQLEDIQLVSGCLLA